MLGLSLEEQRRHDRVATCKDSPVQVDINGEDFIDILSIIDISEGGMGFDVPHRFEGCNLDDLVSMIVQLPEPVNNHFSSMGHIMHISDDAFGVAFVGLSEPARQMIGRYIDARLEIGNA